MSELESRLGDPRMRQAIADRVLKIALKGGDRAALQAAELIQTRIAGPPPQRIEAQVVSEARRIIIVGSPGEIPRLPAEVLEIEGLRSEAEERAQAHRR